MVNSATDKLIKPNAHYMSSPLATLVPIPVVNGV